MAESFCKNFSFNIVTSFHTIWHLSEVCFEFLSAVLVLESLELYNLSQTQSETQIINPLFDEDDEIIIFIFSLCTLMYFRRLCFYAGQISFQQDLKIYKLINRLKLKCTIFGHVEELYFVRRKLTD
jgi:hypothetical protein